MMSWAKPPTSFRHKLTVTKGTRQDTTYVYESESYWDAEKGQSSSRRRVIGKIDSETGEIIPSGKRGRKKKDHVQDILGPFDGTAAFYTQSQEKTQTLEERM